jgi:hypothetical protein
MIRGSVKNSPRRIRPRELAQEKELARESGAVGQWSRQRGAIAAQMRRPSDFAADRRPKEILLSRFPLLTSNKLNPKQALGRSIAGKGREPIGGVGAV